MDFELSHDQEALAEGIASLCRGRFDIAAVREAAETGLDRARWRELAETGVFSLCVPESDGGVGLGWAEAVLVFEQLGRFLVPGPLVATTLAAGSIAAASEGSEVVGSIVRVDGPTYVEHLPWIDTLAIIDEHGVWAVAATEISGVAAPHPLDPLTPVSRVESLPHGVQIGDATEAAQWLQRGALLTAALQLGVAIGATDLAVTYAKEREQFGRPIGAFQAVKHRCADMITRVEVLRAAVYAAGVTVDGLGVEPPERAVAVAKVLASTAAATCGKDCVQVHGGMGYTWEIDAHLYLKRAWALDLAFGDGDAFAEDLAADLVPSPP